MVDTGMGRFGLEPDQAPAVLAESCGRLANVEVDGVFSHLGATFRTDPDSNAYTLGQIGLFQQALDRMGRHGPLPRLRHLASSTGFLGFPGQVLEGGINALRLGTLFLGYSERPPAWDEPPMPVAEVTTTVLAIRNLPAGRKVGYDGLFATTADTRLAVLACGYAHGLHRDLGNQGAVLANGTLAPIVGKPALNHIVLDVTGLDDVEPGTEVTLVGRGHPVYEQGRQVGRGVWEMLLPLLSRARRTWPEGPGD